MCPARVPAASAMAPPSSGFKTQVGQSTLSGGYVVAGNAGSGTGPGNIASRGEASVSNASASTQSAPIAPLIEPPAAFGLVAPGVYRCSASSLAQGLPEQARGWRAMQQRRRSERHSARASTQSNNANGSDFDRRTPSPSPSASHLSGSPSSSLAGSGAQSTTHGNPKTSQTNGALSPKATPTEAFLASLRLKTVLLLTSERRPSALALWCAQNNVNLIHLGLGALADRPGAIGHGHKKTDQRAGRQQPDAPQDAGHVEVNQVGDIDARIPSNSTLSWQAISEAHFTSMVSLEHIVKDSLEIILVGSRLPCLVCDMTGVNETGVVVGCLRRMQRFNFASIRREYHAYAGGKARSSHERFIEMFDTDLVALPPTDQLPSWYAQMLEDDAADENILLRESDVG